MAELIGFTPLPGVEDAPLRGMGTFHFDDGQDVVHEDPELAQYAMTLPPMQTLPDLRLASNDPGFSLTPEQMAMTAATPEDPSLVPAPAVVDPIKEFAAKQAAFGAPEGQVHNAPVGLAPPSAPAAPAAAPVRAKAPAPLSMPAGGGAPGLPPPPTDAERAADFHRLAGDQALRGQYVAPRAAGYVPVQRQGALPTEMAERQATERQAANDELVKQTELARAKEAEDLRKGALQEAMRLSVQKAAEEQRQKEAETRRQRLLDERRALNDSEPQGEFANGNGFAQAMGILGAALLGATGSDAGLRMIDQSIERDLRKKMQVRGSKLQALGEQLGSEEQAISGAKAKIYELLEKEAGNTGKLMQASGIDNQTPAILAQLKQRATENEHEHERLSVGKTVENYQQARAGGRTGPNLEAAANHYEQAAKLSPQDEKEILGGLDSDQQKDFRARMEGIADAEHALNEIDQNIGIQRDAAGNIVNRKEVLGGGIEGAGFFGGRTPNAALSEKGSALNRSILRMTRANVKATSGASASDEEFARAEKDTPVTDEKDLINSLDEKRRELANAKAKAQTLYGGRVERYQRGYGGNRARISAQRGRAPASGSAQGVIQLDSDEER